MFDSEGRIIRLTETSRGAKALREWRVEPHGRSIEQLPLLVCSSYKVHLTFDRLSCGEGEFVYNESSFIRKNI